MKSARAATSFGVAQAVPLPSFASSFALSPVFDQRATSCPALSRCRAMGRPITPNPRNPSCAIEVMILSMKPRVLVTKRVYPEAIEYLRQHAEVDYAGTDDGLTASELLERARG